MKFLTFSTLLAFSVISAQVFAIPMNIPSAKEANGEDVKLASSNGLSSAISPDASNMLTLDSSLSHLDRRGKGHGSDGCCCDQCLHGQIV
ncbi:hypothetical protein G6F36_015927 [Rhizopus arrhizus]|nr:hypothetical protein G6F36_015927 [Rhizopus arrhizus]